MDLGSVSSDDVIESYRRQLADANHQIALLQAQVTKLLRANSEREYGATTLPSQREGS